MTIAQLKAFLAAYDLASFTAAASRLNTSQASVSELIARLEEELDLKLFTRGTRRLVPTPAAAELRVHALEAVTAVDNGAEAMRSMATLCGGICAFGVFHNAGYYGLAGIVQRFHSLYPNVKIRLTGHNSVLMADAVAAREIEAAIVILPVPAEGLAITPIAKDEVLYASATRDPGKGPVAIEELAAANLVLYHAYAGWRDPIRHQILERARCACVKLDPVIEVEHAETAIDLVAAGAGDTVLSRAITQAPGFPPSIQTVRFAEPLYDTIALIHREGAHLSPATQKMAQLAQRMLSSAMRTASRPGQAAGTRRD